MIGRFGPDDFADNIAATLDSLGIANVRLGPATRWSGGRASAPVLQAAQRGFPWIETKLQQHLVQRARAFGCQVIICVDARLSPATVQALKADGCRVALWFPDAVASLGPMAMLVGPYDAVYFKDPLLVDRLRALLDLPVHYLPEACNPLWHRPVGEAGSEPYIVVVGNLYPTRMRLLDRLLRHGVPLRLYGVAPPAFARHLPSAALPVHPPVRREDKARVFHGATAVLNNLHPGEMDGLNCRLFEAAGCGAVVLCEHRPDIDNLFDAARDLLVFRDFESLLAQIRRAREEPQRMLCLRRAASAHAHAEHTYARRLDRILGHLT